ncbi:MAG TPA: hypothetical protein DCX54_04190 [Flavobacteriales bacterium]|nr:hypothetical protein [Flavobacteriales bacterium]
MDTKNFSNLLIKVAGIIIVIVSVKNIPYYIPFYQTLRLPLFVGTVIVPILLPVLIGVLMFTRPENITNKVVVGDCDNGTNGISSETFLKFEQIALSVLGFYLLFQSISDLVFHTAAFVQAKANLSYDIPQSGNLLILNPEFIATIIEFIFAFWLIFKVEGIVAVVNKIRMAGKN